MYYLLLLPLYFLLKKRKKMSNPNTYQIEKNLRDIYQIFGEDVTRNVERIYRLETANFTSGGFTKTFGAGMEAINKKFPYGWTSLEKFWKEQPTNRPLGIIVMKDNQTHKRRMFLEFPNLFSGMFATAYTLQKRGNNAGAWNSAEPDRQAYYKKLLSSQRTTLTDKIKTGAV